MIRCRTGTNSTNWSRSCGRCDRRKAVRGIASRRSQSLTHFVLEEAYEVVDAIERGDIEALKEEIGDHIFEGVFLAQVAADEGLFTVADSLRTVVEKLVRRHPHVFQDDGRVHDAASKERAPSADAALQRWNSLKAQERGRSPASAHHARQRPEGLPSLLRAFKIGKRAAGVGFDWDQTARCDREDRRRGRRAA